MLGCFDWVLVEAVPVPDLPARLVNSQLTEVCWSLACQGAQIHSWVTVPAKSIFIGGGGFAEESTALPSEMGMLCRGSLGQRDTGRGCEGHGPAPSCAVWNNPGLQQVSQQELGRAQAEHSSHSHGSGQPPVWTQHQGFIAAKLYFKHAGKHLPL